jgi:hypothetical protein
MNIAIHAVGVAAVFVFVLVAVVHDWLARGSERRREAAGTRRLQRLLDG